MEPYIVFLTNNNCGDVIDAHSAKCLVDITRGKQEAARESYAINRAPNLSTLGSLRSAQICTCSDPPFKDGPNWCEFDEDGSDNIEEYFSHTCNDQLIDKEKSTVLSEALHNLASQLPDSGAILDVLWPFDIAKCLTLSENLDLFGALKRLVEWHSGVVYFLIADDSDAEDIKNVYATIKEWVDLLHGVIIATSDLQRHKKKHRWRGCIDISGSQATKSLHLDGFSLEEHNAYNQESVLKFHSEDGISKDENVRHRLTEGNLEFVTAVPFHQVPSFYVTHHAYKLSVVSHSDHLSKSRRFLNRLQEDQSLAFILRLKYGTEWFSGPEGKVPRSRGSQQKRQKHWKNMIIESIANVTESVTASRLSGRVGMYQFLVRSDESSSVIAHLFRDLTDFDGRVPLMMGLNDLQHSRQLEAELESKEEREKAVELIASLPHFTADSLLSLERDIEKVQIDVLKVWIDEARLKGEEPTLTSPELSFLLRATREAACNRLIAKGDYFSQRAPLEPRLLHKPKPEYELDPLTHLERVALNLSSSLGCNLTKLNSNENLGGLSPPTGQILTLDASEFLKHFHPDGTALKTDGTIVRPARSPSRRFQKNGSKVLKMEAWPECLRAKDHDVYYNCEETERMEKKCERIKSRMLATETSSTCTLQQARSPPTITIIDSSSSQCVPSPAPTNINSSNKLDVKQDDAEVHRPRAKRKREPDTSLESESKRMLNARKKKQEEKSKLRQSEAEKIALEKKSAKESRSQRHRRKLQEVVEKALDTHGLKKDDPLYQSCVKKLFTLTMCYAKDLKTSHNLREEMEKIAEMHVEQVIQFEKRMKT